MRNLRTSLWIALAASAALPLGGCSFPNTAAPGPTSIAVDSTANQIWLIDSGKIYRCSVNGSALGCTEATTNIPR